MFGHKQLLKIVILSFCLVCVSFITMRAQSVQTMNYEDVKKRLSNGRDTIYIVNFWATWCKPCVEELPEFEFYSENQFQKPIKVLLVSLDFKNKLNTTLIPFVEKRKLKSEVIWLNESRYEAIIDKVSTEWSGALPATLFSTKNNTISLFHEGTMTKKDIEIFLFTLKKDL